MGGFIMRISPTVFRMILLLILICLGIALGFSYYYGVNADYTFEVYIFMTAASFVWVIVAFLVLFFLPRFELSKRQAWVAYHGHIAVAKIVGHYTTETEAQNGKKIIYHHNVVRTEDGLEFTIDYNPILKTDDGVVFIRYDEDTAIFDNRLMKLIYLKKINQSNLSSYITQNENYKPIPSDISGYKRTIFGKKLVFILLGIIILLVASIKRKDEKLSLNHRLRITMVGVAALTAAFICVGMLLVWTPTDSYAIEGVQGRYFTPILPLVLLSLQTSELELDSKWDNSIIYINHIWFTVFVFCIINRFQV